MPVASVVAVKTPPSTVSVGLTLSESVTSTPGSTAPDLSRTCTQTGFITIPATAVMGCVTNNIVDPSTVVIGDVVTPAARSAVPISCATTIGERVVPVTNDESTL